MASLSSPYQVTRARVKRNGARLGVLLLIAALSTMLLGCKSDADTLFERSVSHLRAVVDILEKHKGDDEAALKAVADYKKSHLAEVHDLRRKGAELVSKMTPEQREAFGKRTQEQVAPLLARATNLARGFNNPRAIIQAISEFR